MENKSVNMGQLVLSSKRTEFLLEEILFQYLVNTSVDGPQAEDKFKDVMANIDGLMKEFVESLPPEN